MWSTCDRRTNLPEDVHAVLKARAKAARLSLSDYVAQELTRIAEHATLDEAFARLEPIEDSGEAFDVVAAIRADRGPLTERGHLPERPSTGR